MQNLSLASIERISSLKFYIKLHTVQFQGLLLLRQSIRNTVQNCITFKHRFFLIKNLTKVDILITRLFWKWSSSKPIGPLKSGDIRCGGWLVASIYKITDKLLNLQPRLVKISIKIKQPRLQQFIFEFILPLKTPSEVVFTKYLWKVFSVPGFSSHCVISPGYSLSLYTYWEDNFYKSSSVESDNQRNVHQHKGTSTEDICQNRFHCCWRGLWLVSCIYSHWLIQKYIATILQSSG